MKDPESECWDKFVQLQGVEGWKLSKRYTSQEVPRGAEGGWICENRCDLALVEAKWFGTLHERAGWAMTELQ